MKTYTTQHYRQKKKFEVEMDAECLAVMWNQGGKISVFKRPHEPNHSPVE